MRRIIITRKKRFIGCAIKYEFVINDGLKSGYFIGNGKTIIINTEKKRCTLIVYAYTSTGTVASNQIIIEEDEDNRNYVVVTKYSLIKGTRLILLKDCIST